MTSPPFSPSLLDEAFALSNHSYIFLIGGGGKTTLMFTLARHLTSAGRTVISTTSTKILHPSPEEAGCVIIEDDPARLVSRLRCELPAARHVVVGKSLCDADRKLRGFAADELDRIRQANVADYLIVEADGAAGRSLKAHADYEPVVSPHADEVIAVIGADCIGCPLDDAHVHRAERFAKLLDRAMGTPVTVEDIAAIFFHPLGYLKAVPPKADVVVLITKAGEHTRDGTDEGSPDATGGARDGTGDRALVGAGEGAGADAGVGASNGPRRASVQRLASALRAADRHGRISRIALGELIGPTPFLEPAV